MKKNVLTIDYIKNKLQEYKDKPLKMKVNRGRNKTNFYEGTITNLYPCVFEVKVENNSIMIFSYAELLCGVIKLAVKN